MANDKLLTRRHIVQLLGAGALLTAGGCAPVSAVQRPDYLRPYSRRPWAAPRVSMDAVIRVVVGHRPYRAGGFRIEREKFGNKLVVHNYGHGGGGISLGWGSSALAVRQAADLVPGEVAVIGSGIMGLCTARLLQDAGWSVTIYTRDVYRHTTSNVAAGEWGPAIPGPDEKADPGYIARLDWAARISHHAYTNLTGSKYGVRWMELYELSDADFSQVTHSTFDDLFVYKAELSPGQHPFGNRHARRKVTMQIDPGTLLRQLTTDFQLAGGKFIIRNFIDQADLLTLPESVLFNCTGLGSAALFDDPALMPAKGQLVYLPVDPAVDYITIGGGRGLLYMIPRRDVVILGSTYKRGDSSRNVEPDETERIVNEHRKLFSSFG